MREAAHKLAGARREQVEQATSRGRGLFHLSPVRRIWRTAVHWLLERLYHELAPMYDLVAALVSQGLWAEWTTIAVPLLQGGRVLELGCGTGHLQLALARAGRPHVGVDRSPQMLRQATRRVRRAGHVTRLVRGQARELPVISHSCSDVVATFPAPYILDAATLAEVKRVLTPDGQLIIVDAGVVHHASQVQEVVELVYRITELGAGRSRYAEILPDHGFAVEEQRVVLHASSVDVVIARPE